MRRLAAFLGALALVAGCGSSGGSPSVPAAAPGSAAPGSAATAAPAVAASSSAPLPTAAATPMIAKVRVTFDGSTCAYSGPTVFPLLTTLSITYEPTPAEEGSFVGVFAVRSDATQADFDDPANPDIGAATPSWVYGDTAHFGQGAGVYDYSLTNWLGIRPHDTYMVTCVHSIPGRPGTGPDSYTLLHVIDPTASPAPTPAP